MSLKKKIHRIDEAKARAEDDWQALIATASGQLFIGTPDSERAAAIKAVRAAAKKSAESLKEYWRLHSQLDF